jgi:hypothetical protein
VQYGLLKTCSPGLQRGLISVCKVLQCLANQTTFKEMSTLSSLNPFLEEYSRTTSFFFEQCLFDMDIFGGGNSSSSSSGRKKAQFVSQPSTHADLLPLCQFFEPLLTEVRRFALCW